MGVVYGIFGVGLSGVAVLGAFAGLHIGEHAADRVGVLVTIIATLTGAGLLSLAFTIDKLVTSEINVGSFFEAPSTEDAFASVLWMLAAGTSGLLAALPLTIWDRQPARGRIGQALRRWGAGCLAVSAVAVVLLFPTVVVLIISTHDALVAPLP